MIVGIGEVLWDTYPDGRKVAGGAPFNFAFHCHQLGHPAAIVSRVGDDDLGRELRERVRALGLSDEFIQTDPDKPTGTVAVTHGADGAELLWPEHDECICEPGVPAKVVDTVGAGDSFTAALACKYLEGWPLRLAAQFAVLYSARVCEHQGGTPFIDLDPDG